MMSFFVRCEVTVHGNSKGWRNAILSLVLACAVGCVLAQTTAFKSNAEFEVLIEEARRLNIDPVQLTVERKLPESVAFDLADYIYDKNRAELARIQGNNAKLDAELRKSQERLDDTTRMLVRRYGELLSIFETMKARNQMTSVEVEKIRAIYTDSATPPAMLRRIEMKFGTELK